MWYWLASYEAGIPPEVGKGADYDGRHEKEGPTAKATELLAGV